jgi:signal transduction histidine kinase
LDDVITSLHSQLLDKQIDVQLLSDTQLEIVSFASDWACIFNNLILNSVQHGFKGRQQGTIKIRITHHDSCLRVDYTDDGIGLSQESLARIFDPFFTTDLQQGMGLGMHMLYNIITQQMQGRIVCNSLPLNGAHFNIEIPL